MGILSHGLAHGEEAAAYTVDYSCRFDSPNTSTNVGLYFDPSSSHDSVSIYTFSCWLKRGGLGINGADIFTCGYYSSGSSQNLIYFYFNSSDQFQVWIRSTSDGTNATYTGTPVFRDPAAFYHCVLVRNGTSIKAYMNDVEALSITLSNNNQYGVGSGYPMHIGVSAKPTSSPIGFYNAYDGYIADVHFIDGVAETPGDFAETDDNGQWVPKEYTGGSYGTNGFHLPFTGGHDSELLINSNHKEGSTNFEDSSGAGHNDIDVYGNPEHSTRVGNPFTGTDRAIYFDGTGDYLSISDHDDWNFGTSDFTIETWVCFDNTDAQNIYIQRTDSYNYLWIELTSSTEWKIKLRNNLVFDVSESFSTTVSAGQWYHVAIVRSGNIWSMYQDGVSLGSVTANVTVEDYSGNLEIGRYTGGYNYLNGYLDDFRIVNGTAVYTANFTPPTSKLTEITNTKLLIQANDSDTDVEDRSTTGTTHTITATGVSLPATASTPYEAAMKRSAIYFDGAGDYLSVPGHSDFQWDGAFTLEMWVNFDSYSTYQILYSAANNSNMGRLGWGATQGSWYWYDSPLWADDGNAYWPDTPTAGEWHHIAIVRTSTGDYKCFRDGTELSTDGTYSHLGTVNSGTVSAQYIGRDWTAGSNFAGYIYDLRITKGVAKDPAASGYLDNPFVTTKLTHPGGDDSGNKNHFDVEGIEGHDVVADSPSAGKNFATFNALTTDRHTLSEGNLKADGTDVKMSISTIGVSSGKFQWEVYTPSAGYNPYIGITSKENDDDATWNEVGRAFIGGASGLYKNYNTTSYTADTDLAGEAVWSMALDLDSGTKTLKYYKNGVLEHTDSTIPSATTLFPMTLTTTAGSGQSWTATVINFGQDPTLNGEHSTSEAEFAYPIEGYKSLCTANLAAPGLNNAVDDEKAFSTKIYTGDDGSSETGVGFQPDLTWIKNRDDVYSHIIGDSVRGDNGSAMYFMASNGTGAEDADSGKLVSLDSDGFTVGSHAGAGDDGVDYVAWNWKAGGNNPPASHTYQLELILEDSSDNGWEDDGTYGYPRIHIYEGTASLGTALVPYTDGAADTSKTYLINTNDKDAISIKWEYDDSNDDDEYSYPSEVNGLLNEQTITLKEGSTTLFTVENSSNDAGDSPEYNPPLGWANGDKLYPVGTPEDQPGTVGNLTPGGIVGSFNADAGFSIIKYTGDSTFTGEAQTLTHRLGDEPEMVIVKNRDSQSYGTGDWIVYHKDLGSNGFLILNDDAGEDTSQGNPLISVSDALITVTNDEDSSSSYQYLNEEGINYICYAFRSVEGYSKVGRYDSNASSDGPFIYCGFRPAFVMIKHYAGTASSGDYWVMMDSSRDTYNVVGGTPGSGGWLSANNSDDEWPSSVESAYPMLDFLSNGFKLRATGSNVNYSTNDYIYYAVAENPFKYANAR